MASIMRPTLLRQTRQAAGGLTAALSRQSIRSSVTKESVRIAAFHASSRRSLLPAGQRTFLLYIRYYEKRHIIMSASRISHRASCDVRRASRIAGIGLANYLICVIGAVYSIRYAGKYAHGPGTPSSGSNLVCRFSHWHSHSAHRINI